MTVTADIRPAAKPDLDPEPTTMVQQILVGVFLVVPMLALVAAIPFAWGWGLGWHDIVIGAVFYWVSGFGITVGYHRYFTHSSFKANRALRIALAVAGSLAMEGAVITWVADHRRHHKYSDREGDPHSPWRYGTDAKALAKGLVWSHFMWVFDPNQTSQEKFCPDLLADKDIKKVDSLSGLLVAATLLLPALIGGISSPATSRGTFPGWPSPPSASPGTTCTTPTPPAPATARSAARSTRAPVSSGSSRSSAGPLTSAGRTRRGSPRSVPRARPGRSAA
jgi:fatty acid desaturase